MNDKFKELYGYFKSQGLTDLDESTFYSKYSSPEKSKEIYSYLKQNGMTDLDESSFNSSYFGSKKKEPTVLPSEPKKEVSSSVTAPQLRGPITSRSESSGLVKKEDIKEDGVYKYSGRKDALYKLSGGKWYVSPNGKGKFVELDDPDGKRAAILNKQAVKTDVTRPAAERLKDYEDLRDLSAKETADALGWSEEEVKKASVSDKKSSIKPVAANVVPDVKSGEMAIDIQANSLAKARLELGSNAPTEKINERAKYHDNVNVQQALKSKGYDVDINGNLDSDKTKFALDKMRAEKELDEKEESERNRFIVDINDKITDESISSGKLIEELRSNFSSKGFVFQEFGGSAMGTGKMIKVKYSIGPMMTTKEEAFRLDDPELTTKLRSFMAQSYMKSSEKREVLANDVNVNDEIARFEYMSGLVAKMAEAPQKYGNTLVSEDLFVNHMKSTYNYLRDEQTSISSRYEGLKGKIAAFNQNPTEEGREAINNEIHELSVRELQLTDKYEKARAAEGNFAKISSAYALEKAKTGGLFSGLAAQFAQGLTNVGKMGAGLAADIMPYAVDAVDPLTKNRLKSEGYSEEQIRDYASKEIKDGVLRDLKKGITNIASLGTTTQEYLEMGDRGVLEQTLGFLAESIGTSISGGGAGALTKVAFFSQAYNGMSEQMTGPEFDGLTEHEKKLISVPYGLTIGALERLGFKFTTSTSKNPVLNRLISNTIARTFTSIPKDASIKTIERAISSNLAATMAQSGLRVIGGSIVEGAVEGSQQLAEIGIKNIANAIIGEDEQGFDFFRDVPDLTTAEGVKEAFKLAAVDAAYGALGGAIMSTGENAVSSVRNRGIQAEAQKEFLSMAATLTDSKLRALQDLKIQSELASGAITQEQADERIQSMNKATEVINKIPDGLSTKSKIESFNLLMERSDLESEIQGKDEALVVVQKERIKEINTELQEISRYTDKDADVEVTQPEVVTEEGKVEQEVAVDKPSEIKAVETNDPKTYSEALNEARAEMGKEGPGLDLQVSAVSEQEAQDIVDEGGKIFMTEDGQAGAYVKKDGYMGGLFKNPLSKLKDVAKVLQQARVKAGGRFMEGYATKLEEIYVKNGFRPVARLEFNEEFAPEGWDAENSPLKGKPDVVFFAYDPDGKFAIGDGEYVADYDAAYEIAKNYSPEVAQEVEALGALIDMSSDSAIDSSVEAIVPSKIKTAVKNAAKALSKVAPNVKIVVHSSDADYRKATGEEGNKMSSNGEYNPKTKTIHVNGTKANMRTVAHESFHAILLERVSSDQEAANVTNRMIDSISKKLDADSDLKKYLDGFASNYKENIQNEEKLAELVGKLAENYTSSPQTIKDVITRWLNMLASQFGIGPIEKNETYEVLETIARKVATGKVIKEKDISVFPGGTIVESPSMGLTQRNQYGNDKVSLEVSYIEQDRMDELIKNKLVVESDGLSNLNGQKVVTTSPDDMIVGSISVNGKKVAEGNGGVFFVTKFGDVWANSNGATARVLSKAINESINENGKAYLALVKGTDAKLVSSPQGVTSSLAVTESMLDAGLFSLSDFRAAIRAGVKKNGGDISLSPNGSATQLKNELDEFFKDVSSSTFEKRGNVLKSIIGNLAQSESAKKNKEAIIKFLDGDTNKGLGAGTTPKSQSLIDLVALVSAEKLTKGLNTGDIYAVIEVDGKVDVFQDEHQSYPYHIRMVDENGNASSKKPVLILPKNRKNGKEILRSRDGRNSEELGSAFAGTVGATANLPVGKGVIQDDTDGPSTRKQISPDNSSNYANLTEDSKGNYIFFHYSQERRSEIDPAKYGSKFTSAEETVAIGAVGGVSMYYTDVNTAEQGVGPVAHAVKVPKEKVYDFNADPDNLIEVAREMYEADGSKGGFTPNMQLAYVTKAAEQAGYEMVVAEWNGMTRAQTVSKKTPVDIMKTSGGTVVRPFSEKFSSNKENGWESVIPKSKEKLLNEAYIEIYKERNSQDKYDDLYFLPENSARLEQEQITQMIVNSDLSDSVKQKYMNAVNYEGGKRKSVKRKQLDELVSRKQNKTATSIVSIGRKNGISDAAIRTYLIKNGFSNQEIDAAMAVNNNITIDEIFERSEKALLDKRRGPSIVRAIRFIRQKMLDRQSDVKRIIKGIGSKESARAHALLVTKAGAKGWANYRFKDAEKKIYKGLSDSDITVLNKMIYLRRIIAINENRANLGMEAYRGIDGYSEAEARRDLAMLENQIGDKKFSMLSDRATAYFETFAETLKALYDSGRITEEAYNNLKDVEYSPIATIKYIIGDNLSLDEIDRQAEVYGITRKDIMQLTDKNENEVIMDSRWLLMMNLMSVTGRAWENRMLNSFFDAYQSATQEQKDAINEFMLGGGPSGRPNSLKAPAGFKSISFYKDGVAHNMIVREDYANQLLDVKHRDRAFETVGKLTGGSILRFFATGGNPLFIVGNTAVDFQNILFFSDVYSSFKPLGGIQLTWGVVKNFTSKVANSGQFNQIQKEFIEHGGGMDFLSNDGLRALKAARPASKLLSIPQKLVLAYGNAMSYFGATSEAAFRLAVYDKMKSNLIAKYKKENGSDPTGQDIEDIMFEAARESRETIDFSQGGDWIKKADVVMPYLNASMQGFRKPLDYARKNPAGFGLSMIQAGAMAGGMAYMSYAALAAALREPGDDEDDVKKKMREAMKSVSEHEKASYHIIFTGNKKKDKDGNWTYEYYRIKKLPVLSVLSTLSEQIAAQSIFDQKYDQGLTDKTLSMSAPFMPTELAGRNPLISGLLTYHFNQDTFTDEKVFRDNPDKPIRPASEGKYDDKVEGIYKEITKYTKYIGLESPIRTKAFFEKIITNPSTNPTVAVFYAAANGIIGDKPFSEAMKNVGADVYTAAERKVVRYTNNNVKSMESEAEAQDFRLDLNTYLYEKETKIRAEIKRKMENGEEITPKWISEKVDSEYSRPEDALYKQSQKMKHLNYVKRSDIDFDVISILFEDNPEMQAYLINKRYGSDFDDAELREIREAISKTNLKVSDKTVAVYNLKYKKKK